MRLAELCVNDVVLDTNVLSHADNPGCPSYAESRNAVLWVVGSNVHWVLDDQGKNAPNPATSVLFSEYCNTLAPQSHILLQFISCLQRGRVRFASRPNQTDRERVRKLVPRNKRDQAILGATLGTVDKLLVSNDLDDFSEAVRKKAAKILGTSILSASDFEVDRLAIPGN